MTDHRRGRPVRSAGALLTGTDGAWCAGGRLWAPAALLALGALALGATTVRQRRASARVVTRYHSTAPGPRSPLPVPQPCCRYWENSDGLAHAPGCLGAGSLAVEAEQGWR